MEIKPVNDFVLIDYIEPDTGGIEIPDSVKQAENGIWKVVAVGPGRETEDGKIIPITVCKVGDEVMIIPQTAARVDPGIYGEKKRVLIKATNILAVVEGREGLPAMALTKKIVRAAQMPAN